MDTKMKLLIAYDGSPSAETALDDLPRAGLPSDTDATIICVADIFMPQAEPSETVKPEPDFMGRSSTELELRRARVAQALEEARRLATKASDRLRIKFPDWKIQTEACGHSPAWAIIKKADEWQPNLVLLGSHNRSALGRLFLGSVSQTVLTEARCSVRIGRERLAQGTTPLRILIGIDGSPGAERAIAEVASRPWPPDVKAYLIAVVDRTMSTALNETAAHFKDERTWLKKILETSTGKLQASGLGVSEIVKGGDPKEVLLKEAERLQANCIFLGARGLRRLERFFLGSVSTAIATRAPCSVEIVRPRQIAEP